MGSDEDVSVERAWLQVEGACSEGDCVRVCADEETFSFVTGASVLSSSFTTRESLNVYKKKSKG